MRLVHDARDDLLPILGSAERVLAAKLSPLTAALFGVLTGFVVVRGAVHRKARDASPHPHYKSIQSPAKCARMHGPKQENGSRRELLEKKPKAKIITGKPLKTYCTFTHASERVVQF